MKLYKDGILANHKELFPNVSFPVSGPSDDFLQANNALKVSYFREHDEETQKLIPCNPTIDGGIAYLVEVVSKTEEDLLGETETKAARLRASRDLALRSSDWMAIRAAETGIAMDEEWSTYRQALRDLPDAAGWPNVEIPSSPSDQLIIGNGD